MSRGLRLGGRVFAPSAGFTVLTLLLCALLLRLGVWQWHKGIQRQEEWTRFARDADQVIALGARQWPLCPRGARCVAQGHQLPEPRRAVRRARRAARGAHRAARPAGPVRLRARLAAPRHGAAAPSRLRPPVVELRGAGARRVGDHEHAQKPRRRERMNSPARALRARNLRTLAGLAALFLLPLVAAFFTYYGSPWRPARRVNHGVLITPARPLPPVRLPQRRGAAAAHGTPLRGTWSLVYVGNGACDGACRQALWVMRQTRLALNNDMTRVQRVFLVSAECCAGELLGREQAGLEILDAAGPAGAALLREFPSPGRAHSLFVVDPLGNLMMSYDARRDPHGLLEDLKKLLKLSHIG